MAASMTEQTLAIIKPDAIMAGKQAEILDMIGKNAFTLVSQDLVLLTPERAKAFYAEHDGKAFFEGLTDFMCSTAPAWCWYWLRPTLSRRGAR